MTTRTAAVGTYLPEIECDVRPGMADWEVVATVKDVNGRKQVVSVSNGMVAKVDDKSYLAVGVVQVDYAAQRALVELPNEADSGAGRLWVPFSSFRKGG